MNFEAHHQPEPIATHTSARRTNALFVCSLGRMRSLTAEHESLDDTDERRSAHGVSDDEPLFEPP